MMSKRRHIKIIWDIKDVLEQSLTNYIKLKLMLQKWKLIFFVQKKGR